MKQFICTLFLAGTMAAGWAAGGTGNESLDKEARQYKMPVSYLVLANRLYQQMGLQQRGLEKDVFLQAYKGYLLLLGRGLVRQPDLLSIADFSQSSKNKRLYILDLKQEKVLMQTVVMHGKNSGADMATSFSNVNNSNKSVLGFLLTADTYIGSHGLSLRFRGMEPGINDMVTNRAIVVHGSKFITEQTMRQHAVLTNSLGCPAVPMSQSKFIIQAIKGGSVYFIYHPDEHYAQRSAILNASLDWALPLPAALALPALADSSGTASLLQ